MIDNVRDFGAVGDGACNDAPAIQAALDAAAARGGGTVYVPPGRFVVGEPGQATPSLILAGRVTLRGDSSGCVLARAPGGHSRPLIHNRGRTTATGGTGQGDVGIVIADLVLDGDRGDTSHFASNEQGVWLSQCVDSSISRVWSLGQRTNGFCLEYCDGVSLAQCVARDNLKNGYYLSGSDHCTLTACEGHRNGSPGSGIGSSFSFACSWHCALSACTGRDDEGPALLTGRDTQYLAAVGGTYDGLDVTTEPVNAPLPPHFDRTGAAGPYDGSRKYGTSHSLFSGLVVHAPGGRRWGIRFVGDGGNLVVGCLIRGVALNGVQLHGSSGNVVRGCSISNVGLVHDPSYRAAICIVAEPAWPQAGNNRIDDNDIFDDQPIVSTDQGFLAYTTGGVVVEGLTRLWRNRFRIPGGRIEVRANIPVHEIDNILEA